jgi:hypothetical protein
MTGKTFHEAGIAVPATMATPDIRINTVVKSRNGCLAQNGLGKDFFDFH